jgi:Cft2 family RNA processing exonuclease
VGREKQSLTLQFLGGVGTVTGSKFLIGDGNNRILLDCGLFQGLKDLRQRNWATLPLDLNSLRAVVLTHAHIDHSGYLPKLVKLGFRGNVYATGGTCDLLKVLYQTPLIFKKKKQSTPITAAIRSTSPLCRSIQLKMLITRWNCFSRLAMANR